jgi:hypothetical protein
MISASSTKRRGRTDEAFTASRRGHQADSTYPPILYNLGKFTLDRFIRLYQSGELTEGVAEEQVEWSPTSSHSLL